MNPLKKLSTPLLIVAVTFLSACNSTDPSKIAETVPAPQMSVEVIKSEPGEKPFKATTSEINVTAGVTAINHKTREVTIVNSDGVMQTFIADKNARNLDQVAVGDMVTIKYLENVTVVVMSGEGVNPSQASEVGMSRSDKGELPAGVISDTEVESFIVEAIDIKANTFKLRNADGDVKEFTAADPQVLKDAEVGDAVVISTTQAIAIEVTELE